LKRIRKEEVQNYWVSGPYPAPGILNAGKPEEVVDYLKARKK
jgi:hypothetical protein